eukprot:UN02134
MDFFLVTFFFDGSFGFPLRFFSFTLSFFFCFTLTFVFGFRFRLGTGILYFLLLERQFYIASSILISAI